MMMNTVDISGKKKKEEEIEKETRKKGRKYEQICYTSK